MTQWYEKNYTSPYPSYRDCEQMASSGAISIAQVKQWFVNIRRRTQNKFRNKQERLTKTPSNPSAQLHSVQGSYSSPNQSIEYPYSQISTQMDSNKYENLVSSNESNIAYFQSPICHVVPIPYYNTYQYQYPALVPYYSNSNYTSSPLFSNSYSSSVNSPQSSTCLGDSQNLDSSYYSSGLVTDRSICSSPHSFYHRIDPSLSESHSAISSYTNEDQLYFY